MKKFLILFLLTFAVLGLLHDEAKSEDYNFSIDMPPGWRKMDIRKYFLITSKDPFQHYILIQERPLTRPFKHTDKKLNENMLPHEVAQMFIEELAADKQIVNFHVIETAPATINDYEAFKIVFSYDLRDGSRYKTVYYGFLKGDYLYSLRFNAKRKDQFERHLHTFNEVLDSFVFVEESGG